MERKNAVFISQNVSLLEEQNSGSSDERSKESNKIEDVRAEWFLWKVHKVNSKRKIMYFPTIKIMV